MPAHNHHTLLQKDEHNAAPNSGNWLDRLIHFQFHFGRFLWDVIGVFLEVGALLAILGMFGISKGSLLSLFVSSLRIWFGWGSALIIIAVAFAGLQTFRWNWEPIKVRWGKIVTSELAIFLTLAVLSVISGFRLTDEGMWGGRIGWGLSMLVTRFLGPFFGGAVIFILWGLTLTSYFGLWSRLENWLIMQSGEPVDVDFNSFEPETKKNTLSPELPQMPSTSTVEKKSAIKIPPEFRKSFKVPERQNAHQATQEPRGEHLPPLNVLFDEQSIRPDERNINQIAGLIEKTLVEFGVPAKVVGFKTGPSVTQFAVEPGFIKKSAEEDAQQMKVRVAQIAALQKDLTLALSAERLRIEAPVPGRAYVGIEVPNQRSTLVRLRSILETEILSRVGSPLAIALGRDVSGQPVVADLVRMPHLLIAGTTGSGKSVCIAALTACLTMNNTPEEMRLVMIDSKMVELIRFNGLPHLYGKVETNIQRILGVLRWVVVEMEHRYKLLESAKARDIDGYNRYLHRRKEPILPRIVVLIDELADLMMSAPDQTEHNLVRLAQMARATGIHLVVATQRPSTDVVTGLIKANFPARLSFAVASQVDSRVILDMPGAETLLGRGDMLFLNPEVGNPVRAQGVIVTDQEIERIIAFWQKITPTKEVRPPWESLLSQLDETSSDDVLIEQAIALLKKEQRASASLLQRRLRIGYPRAARLLDQLEEMGLVGPSMGGGREREVLIEMDEDKDDSKDSE